MPTGFDGGYGGYFKAPRKRWRYPGVEVPYRLRHVYWDYAKGKDPEARV